jgi:hypothetical protein
MITHTTKVAAQPHLCNPSFRRAFTTKVLPRSEKGQQTFVYITVDMSDLAHCEKHPLARDKLPILKLLQAEGQTVGSHGYHMQLTGYYSWGFVIYRCDYSDNA